jgi:peptidyl-prolyl cis-trans isomerase SurA
VAAQSADFIVAIVNSEPVTNNEVRQKIATLAQQITQQGQNPPPRADLARVALERLVQEKAQMHLAKEGGLKVDDGAVDAAEQSVARRNQIDVLDLRQKLRDDGVSVEQFRENLRQQITLSRLREREVESRIKVTDQDVEQYLIDERSSVDPSRLMLNLAHVLISVPETANAAQVGALQARAGRALARAQAGEDFTSLVKEFSEASGRSVGGLMGMRLVADYPSAFVDAARGLEIGQVAPVFRSDAGFHVLKLVERAQAGLPAMTVVQSRVRHILKRPTAQLSESAAVDLLSKYRDDLQSNRVDFASLAKAESQDGSADKGGDLGWTSPGTFVPEFEEVVSGLAPGDIAQPLVSRFGVHLIQLMDRREAKLTEAEQREVAKGVLRDKKLDEAYANWAQEVRGRAYVELRDTPE